jgi:hypothetical protein
MKKRLVPKTAAAAQFALGEIQEATKLLPRLAYTIEETAKILGLSYISVWRLIERRKLKCSAEVPGKRLIAAREIESFISRSSVFSPEKLSRGFKGPRGKKEVAT